MEELTTVSGILGKIASFFETCFPAPTTEIISDPLPFVAEIPDHFFEAPLLDAFMLPKEPDLVFATPAEQSLRAFFDPSRLNGNQVDIGIFKIFIHPSSSLHSPFFDIQYMYLLLNLFLLTCFGVPRPTKPVMKQEHPYPSFGLKFQIKLRFFLKNI